MSDDEDTSFVVQQAPNTFNKHGHGRDAFIEDASHALLLPSGYAQDDHEQEQLQTDKSKGKKKSRQKTSDPSTPAFVQQQQQQQQQNQDHSNASFANNNPSFFSAKNLAQQQQQLQQQLQQQPPQISPTVVKNLLSKENLQNVMDSQNNKETGDLVPDSNLSTESNDGNDKTDAFGDQQMHNNHNNDNDEDQEDDEGTDQDLQRDASHLTPRSSNESMAYEGYGSYNPTNHQKSNKNPEQIVFWDSAAQRPKESASGLRTWNGVFLPVTTGILGVVLFLKMPYIVGQCGLVLVVGLLLACYFISGMTTLSIAALSTNGFVGEGGPYYLSSRVLGAANGVAVGISFLIGNLISGAFFVTGSSNFALRVLHSENVLDWANVNPYTSTIATASVLLLLLLVVSMIGIADWFRIVTLTCILVATVDVIVTCFDDYSFGIHGLTGFSWSRMHQNLWPNFTDGMTVAGAIGTLFPSVGGIMAGLTMSGEIRNASKGIPRGIGYSLITTFIFYIVVTFFISGSFERDVLAANSERSLMEVTQVYLYVPGALLSCFAAALSNLVGSSRVLFAMLKDDLLPQYRIMKFMRSFSKRGCVVFCWIFMQIAIVAIGNNYTDASIVGSLVLLSSYLALNVGCFLSSISGVISFRPIYNFFSDFTALVAACSCVIGMFIIHPLGAAVIICLHIICQFLVGTHMDPSKITWGDASQPLTFFMVRKLLLNLDERKEHIRHWRPSLLHVITDFHVSHNLIHFCNNIKKGGLYELFHVLEGDFTTTAGSCHLWKRWTIDFIAASGMKAFAVISFGQSIREAVQQAIRGSGLGAMRPNSIMLSLDELDNQEFHRQSEGPSEEKLQLYGVQNRDNGDDDSRVSSTLSMQDGEPQREKYKASEANLVKKAHNLMSLGNKFHKTGNPSQASKAKFVMSTTSANSKPNFSLSKFMGNNNNNNYGSIDSSATVETSSSSSTTAGGAEGGSHDHGQGGTGNLLSKIAQQFSKKNNNNNNKSGNKDGPMKHEQSPLLVSEGSSSDANNNSFNESHDIGDDHPEKLKKRSSSADILKLPSPKGILLHNTHTEYESKGNSPSLRPRVKLQPEYTSDITKNSNNNGQQEAEDEENDENNYTIRNSKKLVLARRAASLGTLKRSPTFFVNNINRVLLQRTRPESESESKSFSATLNENLGNEEDAQVLMDNLRTHRDICIYANGVDSLTYRDGDHEFAAIAHDITHLHLNLFMARNFWKLDSHRLNTGNRDTAPFYIDLVSPDPSDAVLFLSAFCLSKTAIWKRVAKLRVVDFVARSVDVDDAMLARRHMLKLRRIEAEVQVVAFDELPEKAKIAIDKILEKRLKTEEGEDEAELSFNNSSNHNKHNHNNSNNYRMRNDEKKKRKSSASGAVDQDSYAKLFPQSSNFYGNDNIDDDDDFDNEEYQQDEDDEDNNDKKLNDDTDDDDEESGMLGAHGLSKELSQYYDLSTTKNGSKKRHDHLMDGLQMEASVTLLGHLLPPSQHTQSAAIVPIPHSAKKEKLLSNDISNAASPASSPPRNQNLLSNNNNLAAVEGGRNASTRQSRNNNSNAGALNPFASFTLNNNNQGKAGSRANVLFDDYYVDNDVHNEFGEMFEEIEEKAFHRASTNNNNNNNNNNLPSKRKSNSDFATSQSVAFNNNNNQKEGSRNASTRASKVQIRKSNNNENAENNNNHAYSSSAPAGKASCFVRQNNNNNNKMKLGDEDNTNESLATITPTTSSKNKNGLKEKKESKLSDSQNNNNNNNNNSKQAAKKFHQDSRLEDGHCYDNNNDDEHNENPYSGKSKSGLTSHSIGSDVTEASRGSDIGNIRRALATPHQRSLIVNCLYKNYDELVDRTALVFARVPCFKVGKFTPDSSSQWMREVRSISHGMPPMLMCCGEGALVSANDW